MLIRDEMQVPPPDGPIFVTGSSRSGTTLVAHVLDRHPDVHALSELHFFEDLWLPSTPAVPLAAPDALALATELLARLRAFAVTFRARRSAFTGEARALVAATGSDAPTALELLQALMTREAGAAGATRAVEHTPRTIFHLREVLELLPEAQAIVVLRDPRAVLASQKHKWRSAFLDGGFPRRERLRLRAGYHPVTTTVLWRGATLAAERLSGHPRVQIVRFEELVASPWTVVDRLCAFLGLEPDERLLDVQHLNSSYRPAGAARLAAGFEAASATRWRDGHLSATEVYLCQVTAGDAMRRHGYARDPARPSPLALVGHGVGLPLKSIAALALNAGRYRRLGDAVRRRLPL